MEQEAGSQVSAALSKIKIVLVGTTHPGNIGSSARAMKVMGLERLCLVNPKTAPNAESYALAAGADDILDTAVIVNHLSEAIAECTAVYGTTARERTLAWPVLTPREAAESALAEGIHGNVALVFGAEHSGLSNEEVSLCQQLIRIPTAKAFSSLNLAQAVQVCAYELCVAAKLSPTVRDESPGDDPPTPIEDTERLYQHWISLMTEVGYLFPDNPRLLPQRVRRMLAKARFSVSETQIFRGFLAAVEKTRHKP